MATIDDQARAWRRRLDALRLQQAHQGLYGNTSVLLEIEDLEKALSKVDDIKQQLNLLAIHRRNAHHFMHQLGHWTRAEVPVHIITSLEAERQSIARIKEILWSYYKVSVDPDPADEDAATPPTPPSPPAPSTLDQVRERLHTLEYLMRQGNYTEAYNLVLELRTIVGY